MSNANFNTINVKQLNFTGDHILKRGQPTMLATLDMSGVGHYKRLCVDNLAVGKGDNDCIDLNYVLDVSGASKLNGTIGDSNGNFGNNGQVITSNGGSAWTWQDPSSGTATANNKWESGLTDNTSSTIYHSDDSATVLARVGIGNFSGQTSLTGQAKATLDVDSGTSTESMRSSFKLGTISSTGVFQNAPFSAMMGDGNSLNGIDNNHGASFILGHSCTLTGWSCAAIGRHNVVNMPNPVSSYASKGAIALGNYAYAGIKDTAAGPGDIGFAIGTGIDNVAGEPTYSSNNNKFVIDIDGNVGIGTNAPSEKLEVNGTVKATSGFVGNITGNVTGNAGTVTVTAEDTTSATRYLTFVDNTGTQGIKRDTNLHYNPYNNALTAGGFYGTIYTQAQPNITSVGTLTGLNVSSTIVGSVNGSSASCTGNAATATILQNTRTIGGVSFNGSASIDLPGVNTIGNQNTTGNAATATTAGTVTVTAEDTTSATRYLTFVDNTGTQGIKRDTNLHYNPYNNALTAGGFYGTIYTQAQPNITSVGTLTGLTVSNPIAGSVNGSSTSCTGNAATATKIASIPNSNIVQLGVTQTLINKTLTSPTITSPTITSPTITGTGAIAGTFTGGLTGDVNGDLTGTILTPAQTSITSVGELDDLVVDGKVGIGTNSPSAKLEVSGNVKATVFKGNLEDAIHVWTRNVRVGSDTSGNCAELGGPPNGFGYLDLSGNGAVQIRLDASGNSYFLANNVGIGTISPSAKLEVAGDISCNSLRDASGNIGTSGQVLSSTGSDLKWVSTTEHGPWDTSGVDIYYNGKVGIGTSNPVGALNVIGGIVQSGVVQPGLAGTFTFLGHYNPTQGLTMCGVCRGGAQTQQAVNNLYPSGNLQGKVILNQTFYGYQEWVVPETGVYEIQAIGACGGSASRPLIGSGTGFGGLGGGGQNGFSAEVAAGGRAAKVTKTYKLTQGTILVILVGSPGGNGLGGFPGTNQGSGGTGWSGNVNHPWAYSAAGGGGGGTFVAIGNGSHNGNIPQGNSNPSNISSSDVLLVAGGGAGARAIITNLQQSTPYSLPQTNKLDGADADITGPGTLGNGGNAPTGNKVPSSVNTYSENEFLHSYPGAGGGFLADNTNRTNYLLYHSGENFQNGAVGGQGTIEYNGYGCINCQTANGWAGQGPYVSISSSATQTWAAIGNGNLGFPNLGGWPGTNPTTLDLSLIVTGNGGFGGGGGATIGMPGDAAGGAGGGANGGTGQWTTNSTANSTGGFSYVNQTGISGKAEIVDATYTMVNMPQSTRPSVIITPVSIVGSRFDILAIGKENDGSYPLDVSGQIRCTSVIQTSDIRLKENIETITNAASQFTSLRGVSFNLKNDESKRKRYGVVAQEIEKVFPSMVYTNENKDKMETKSVAYTDLFGVAIETIKNLNTRLVEVEEKLKNAGI